MSFIEDADSLRAKTGLGRVRLPLVLAVMAALVLCVVLVGVYAFGLFATPGVSVEHVDDAAVDAAEGEEALPATIYIHVAGAVEKPGLYALDEGSRVQDAIECAGGFSEDAVAESVNLARTLVDGEQIVVGSASADGSSDVESAATGAVSTGKVNINSANAAELTTLSGVGEATAAKIIAYREANGPFSTIEDIKKVSGIGDKKFEAIKDAITV